MSTAMAERKTRNTKEKPEASANGTDSKRTMDPAHKEAIAAGRREAAAVRKYVEAVDANRPKRGRKVTAESLNERLEKVNAELAEAGPFDRLLLNQDKRDIEAAIARLGASPDLSGLEAEFVKYAKTFADRKGLKAGDFKELGIKPEVLKAAGF